MTSNIIDPDFLDFCMIFDFLCFVETWASNVNGFLIAGFNQVSTIRKKMANAIRYSGGIIILLQDKSEFLLKN